MTEFRLEVLGTQRVSNKLRGVASFHPEVTTPVMKRWAQEKSKQLRNTAYPPERPGQKYKRTGRLGRSWRAMNPRPGVVSIINLARTPGGKPYAHWVVGDAKGEGQAWMHVSRWWKARDIIEETTPTLTAELTLALRKVISK